MDLVKLQNTPPCEWPEETGEMLLDLLTSGRTNAEERLIAVELAGDFTVINDDLARVLLKIAKNDQESEEIRGAAIIALGPALEHSDMMGFEDEDEDDLVISEELFNTIQKSLQKLYMTAGLPKDLRRRALEASAHAPQPWHQGAVRSAYESKDEEWRITAVFCMGFIEGFEPQIIDSLRSSNELIHFYAVVAAGHWEVDGAWEHIVDLVRNEDTEKELRLAAIEALPDIRSNEAIDILNELVKSEDLDIVDAAYEAMAMAEGLEEIEDEDEDEI